MVIVKALAAADAVPRRDRLVQRAHSLHGHQQPVTDIELIIHGELSSWYLRGWGFAGPSGRARRSWPEHGGSSLLSLLAAPASEAPRLPTSPPAQKKNSDTEGGVALFSIESLSRFVN